MSEYLISSGTVSSGVAVSDYSAMYISSGGTADSTTINDNGKMYISPDGTANSTTINGNGNMFISSGGIASNTTINDKGTMHILSSGTADSTTVSSAGRIYISSGGTANNTSVYSCGYMNISSGGSANSVSVQSGARIYIYGTVDSLALAAGGSMGGFIFAEDKYFEKITDGLVSISENVILEGSKMDISSNGSVNEITITDECQMFINSGGSADNTIISGGWIALSSGGTANNAIFESAGDMYIYGGTANNAVIGHYGDMYVYFGGTANDTTLTTTGRISISSGGTANNTIFNQGGSMNIELGGTANSNTLYGGWLTIASGGTANNTTLKEHSEMNIELGGIANNTGVYYDIYLGICGTANSTTIYDGGTMAISSGGTANNTTVDSGGTMAISSGGAANSTTVYDGGWITISSGGSAEALTLSAGGLLGGFSYEKDKYFDNVSNGSAIIADNVHIIDSGMYILSGGTADSTFVNNRASMNITSGGTANNTTVNFYGNMNISSGGIANNTAVNPYGSMFLSSGSIHRGTLQIASEAVVSVDEGAVIDFTVAGRNADEEYLINDLSLIQGAPTYTITVDNDPTNGTYKLAQGAENFIETMVIGNGTNNYGTLTVNGNFCRYNGMIFFLDQLDGNLTLTIAGVEEEQIAIPSTTTPTNEAVTVSAAYSEDSIVKQYKIGENGQWVDYTQPFCVANNATIYFREIDADGNESTSSYVIDNIDKTAPGIPTGFTGCIAGYNAKLDWACSSDTGVSGIKGYYIRYGTSEALIGEGEFIEASEFSFTDLAVGTYYYQVKTEDNAGNISDWSAIKSFDIVSGAVQNLQSFSWNAISGVESYIVEYSTDNFATSISFEAAGNEINSVAFPMGTYQWRVKTVDGEVVSNEENVTVLQSVTEPQEFISDADGNIDVFFFNAKGKWLSGYIAQHDGILDGWSGIGEQVSLCGKNKLADIFEGSTDANILVMTDDINGDALFVDDIYTALPGTVSEQQARIAQIDEIRAGNGNDIIDLTSQRFKYVGDGVKIYGGLGDDTIWANNGSNTLYGDAGNDRIVGGAGNDLIAGGAGNDSLHGGGGNDIFTFCADWGNDTVEQLADGEITLWFESGSESNWNADTLTYTNGANSVKVSGVSADNVTLIFGDNGSLRYDELSASGSFDDAASEKIFEDKNKGMLA